ncbi:MAG: hypothetical protein ACREUF_08805, partial [Solimonas sp.]
GRLSEGRCGPAAERAQHRADRKDTLDDRHGYLPIRKLTALLASVTLRRMQQMIHFLHYWFNCSKAMQLPHRELKLARIATT